LNQNRLLALLLGAGLIACADSPSSGSPCELVLSTESEAPAYLDLGRRLAIELTWDTAAHPAPSSPGPGEGADLDLHVLHPNAAGVWFHESFSCHPLNPRPVWVEPGSSPANPHVDRDDFFGGGPEWITIEEPEDHATYTVGVHAFDTSKSGPATPTLRVYIDGDLIGELRGPPLETHDLWEALTIQWSDQSVTPIVGDGCAPVVPSVPYTH